MAIPQIRKKMDEFETVPPTLESAFKIKKEIEVLEEHIKVLKVKYTAIIEDHVAKKNYAEGNFSISPVTINRRVLDQDRFMREFPHVYEQIADIKIPIMKAEALIGKEMLNRLCSFEQSTRYELKYSPTFAE